MEETFEAADGTFTVETYVSRDGKTRTVYLSTGDEWHHSLTFQNGDNGLAEFRKLATAMAKAADFLDGI